MKDYSFQDVLDIRDKYKNNEIDEAEAIKSLRKLNSKHPNELVRIEIAKLEIKRGNREKGASILQKICDNTNSKENKDECLYYLTTIDAHNGNFEEAEKRRLQIKSGKYQNIVDYNLGKNYRYHGNAEKAQEKFENLLEREDNTGALFHLAYLAINDKEYELAEKYAQDLERLQKPETAIYIRAYIKYLQEEYKESRNLFMSLYGTSHELDAKYRVATIAFKESDDDYAMDLLSELHNTSIDTHARIYEGLILDSEGFHQEALSIYLNILNELANNTNIKKKAIIDHHIYINIANALSNLGRYDESRKYLDMVTDSNVPSAQYFKICDDVYEGKNMDALKKIDEYKSTRDYMDTPVWYYVYTNVFTKKEYLPDQYMLKQIRKYKDKKTIEHIEKHLEVDESKPIHTTFYKNIDIHNLYFDIRNKIQNMNYSYRSFTSFYIVKADYPVGCLNGKETEYICVVTLPNSKKIVTMYPMCVSKRYLERHSNMGRNGISD